MPVRDFVGNINMCGKTGIMIDSSDRIKKLTVKIKYCGGCGFKNCVYSRYSHRLKESLDQNFLDAVQVEETSDDHLYGRLEVYCVETNTILHSPRRLTRFCCFENVMNDMKVEIQEELNRSTTVMK